MSENEISDPWDKSRYSLKVAKTPGRKIHPVWEQEAELFEVIVENYVGDSFLDIERILNIELLVRYIDKTKIKIAKKKNTTYRTHFKGISERIVELGKQQDVLSYLKLKLQIVTRQIEENPLFNGKFLINDYEGEDWVYSWDDPYDPIRHDLVGTKLFRQWLQDFLQDLTIESGRAVQVPRETISKLAKIEQAISGRENPPAKRSKKSNSSSIESFKEGFSNPDKANQLNDILQLPEIDWLHQDGRWKPKATELVVLVFYLQEGKFLTLDFFKLNDTQKVGILFKHFHLKMTSQLFGRVYRQCSDAKEGHSDPTEIKETIIRKCKIIVNKLST